MIQEQILMYVNELQEMQYSNYQAFVQALIFIETGIMDKKTLQDLYQQYMHSDRWNLLNDRFYERE